MLATLLELTVALGVVYLGLAAARYRNEALQAVAPYFQNRMADAESIEKRDYDQFMYDSHFSDNHYRVSAWFGELPDGLKQEISESTKQRFLPNQSQNKKKKEYLPPQYVAFQNNNDAKVVLVGSVLAPLASIWDIVCMGRLLLGFVSGLRLCSDRAGDCRMVHHERESSGKSV